MAWIRARLMPESITCRKSRSILTIKKTGGLFDKPVLKENAQRYPIYLLMMLKAGIFPAFFNTCILYQTTGIFRRDLKTQGQRIYNIWENICWKESQLLKEYTKRTVMISAIRIHWPSFSFDCNFRLTVFAVYRRHIAEGRIRKLRYSYFFAILSLF